MIHTTATLLCIITCALKIVNGMVESISNKYLVLTAQNGETHMKLSIGVIADALAVKPDYVCGETNHALSLADIRIFPPDGDYFDSSTLYFENWKNLEKHSGIYPEYLVCVGGNDSAEELFAKEKICGFIFCRNDYKNLFSSIQSVFLQYNQLEYILMEALIQSKPTRDILNICSEFFGNHVLLFDSLLNLIDYSSIHMPEVGDKEWNETYETSKISIKLFEEIRRRKLASNPSTSFDTEFFDLSPNFKNRISLSLYHNSRRIGDLSVSESDKPLAVCQTKILDHLASLVSSTFIKRYATLFDSMEILRTMLSGMLNGLEPDQMYVARTLKLVNWHLKDNYCLISIRIPDIGNDTSRIFHRMYEYENTFPDCVGFIFLDNILLLIHNDTKAIMVKCIPKLEKLLITHDAYCGVGIPFCSIFQINAQYLNACMAIQIGNKNKNGNERIVFLKDCLDEHITSLVTGVTSIIPVCHRAAVRIMEYDRENGTELLESLEVYLRQNRSVQVAANELFIHRNTLTYRLRRVKALVSMDLENSHERLHILLSCIVLRIMGSG